MVTRAELSSEPSLYRTCEYDCQRLYLVYAITIAKRYHATSRLGPFLVPVQAYLTSTLQFTDSIPAELLSFAQESMQAGHTSSV